MQICHCILYLFEVSKWHKLNNVSLSYFSTIHQSVWTNTKIYAAKNVMRVIVQESVKYTPTGRAQHFELEAHLCHSSSREYSD